MQTTNILLAVSALLTILCVVPYIRDTLQGRTKPQIVTWFVWSMLTAIAAVASFADDSFASGMLGVFASVSTALVVIVGWRQANRNFETLDVVCFIAALVGLGVWWASSTALAALFIVMAIDLVGAVPTLRHITKKPFEETAKTFAMAGMGGFFALLAVDELTVEEAAFPVYISLINLVFVLAILMRRRYQRSVHTTKQQNNES